MFFLIFIEMRCIIYYYKKTFLFSHCSICRDFHSFVHGSHVPFSSQQVSQVFSSTVGCSVGYPVFIVSYQWLQASLEWCPCRLVVGCTYCCAYYWPCTAHFSEKQEYKNSFWKRGLKKMAIDLQCNKPLS